MPLRAPYGKQTLLCKQRRFSQKFRVFAVSDVIFPNPRAPLSFFFFSSSNAAKNTPGPEDHPGGLAARQYGRQLKGGGGGFVNGRSASWLTSAAPRRGCRRKPGRTCGGPRSGEDKVAPAYRSGRREKSFGRQQQFRIEKTSRVGGGTC